MTSYRPIEIIIADDHQLIRDGFNVMFSRITEINIIAEAKNGAELVEFTRRLKPDVVVTDVKMPVMDGVEATRKIKKEFPGIGIVALSTFDEAELIYEMCEAGAGVYILKDCSKDEMITAIQAAHNNQNYFCRTIQAKLKKLHAHSVDPANLPRRMELNVKELQILRLVCDEMKSADIAKKLRIGIRTVEDYRGRLIEKTNSKNVAGLVKYAIKNKLFKNE